MPRCERGAHGPISQGQTWKLKAGLEPTPLALDPGTLRKPYARSEAMEREAAISHCRVSSETEGQRAAGGQPLWKHGGRGRPLAAGNRVRSLTGGLAA